MHPDAHRPLATGGRRAWRGALVAALLGTLCANGAAAASLGLRFDDCLAGADAVALRMHTCALGSPALELYVSFTLDAPVDSVLALEVVVDLQHASPALPDWWHLEPGGCRAGRASASADFAAAPDCIDPWMQGAPLALLQTIAVGQPRGGASQMRLIAAVGVPAAQAVSLPAGTSIHAVRLRIDGTTSGPVTPSCAGCASDACLVLNSITLVRSPLAADLSITHSGAAGDDRVLWQGAGADCLAVPVRSMTWGRIKSLYH